MSVRRSTVEHPFGTIKACTGPCHFLTRRLAAARMEMALNAVACTTMRMIAPVGIQELFVAIPEWEGVVVRIHRRTGRTRTLKRLLTRQRPEFRPVRPDFRSKDEIAPLDDQAAEFPHSRRPLR